MKIQFALFSAAGAGFAVGLPDRWFFAVSMEPATLSWIKKLKLGYGSWRQSGKVWLRQISKKTVASAPLMSALSTNAPIAPSLAKAMDK